MRIVARWLIVLVLLLGGWAAPLPAARATPALVLRVITALSPAQVAVGGGPVTLTVVGFNLSGAQLAVNAVPRATTTINNARLTVPLTAAEINAGQDLTISLVSQAASLTVGVYNPAANDTTADRFLGQPDFYTHTANLPLLAPAGQLNGPRAVALDPNDQRVYLADIFNHRVLSWPSTAARANGQAADVVIGQPDFTSTNLNITSALTPTAASLYGPLGLAVDAAGRLYVADWGNNRVLEYDTPLTKTTADRVFGQSGFGGYQPNVDGGSPDAFTLNAPRAVAVDALGRLYVADTGNHRVLEFATPLTKTTADRVFGQVNFVSGDANLNGSVTPTVLSLSSPSGLAIGAGGELFVADTGNNRLLEYPTPQTSVSPTRVWGQAGHFNTADHPPASAASLSDPTGLALDPQGNLYVADSGFNRVLEFDQAATSDTLADQVFGQGDSFTATQHAAVDRTTLDDPTGVALDSNGSLWIADFGNSRLLGFDEPVPLLTSLSPSAVAAGSPDFTLTADGLGFGLNTIFAWNGNLLGFTQFAARLSATIPAAEAAVPGVYSITVSGGTLPLTVTVYLRAAGDTTADTVQGQPSFTSALADNPFMPLANQLSYPAGLVVDARTGRLFVADTGNNRVLSWPNAAARANGQAADVVIGQPDFSAHTVNVTGAVTPTAASLAAATGVALDAQGRLYVADTGNSRVLEFDTPLTHPVATRVFGQPNFTSFRFNLTGAFTATALSLRNPEGVAVDAQGRLYVADTGNNRVLEYAAPLTNPAATRVFGQPDFSGATSNITGAFTPTAASLYQPRALAVDGAGRLYVADTQNGRVLLYPTPQTSALATLVLGQPGLAVPPSLQPPSADSLMAPVSLALDARGDLFVGDNWLSRVLEYDQPAATDTTADRVFGQLGQMTTGDFPPPSADSVGDVHGLALDARGDLFVADNSGARVLEYDVPVPARLYLPLARR